MSHRIAAYLEDSPRVVAMPCSLVVDRLEEAWYVDRDCHDHDGQEVVGQDLTRESGVHGVDGESKDVSCLTFRQIWGPLLAL